MGTKKNFVLRVNQDVYDALERWAADEFRSVNGQIEFILHNALKASKRDRRVIRPYPEQRILRYRTAKRRIEELGFLVKTKMSSEI